jgi:hypothetical protein
LPLLGVYGPQPWDTSAPSRAWCVYEEDIINVLRVNEKDGSRFVRLRDG